MAGRSSFQWYFAISRLEEEKDRFIDHFLDSSSEGTWDNYMGTHNSRVHSEVLVLSLIHI